MANRRDLSGEEYKERDLRMEAQRKERFKAAHPNYRLELAVKRVEAYEAVHGVPAQDDKRLQIVQFGGNALYLRGEYSSREELLYFRAKRYMIRCHAEAQQ